MKKEVIDSRISDLSFHTRHYLTQRCHCYFLLRRLFFLQWPGLAYHLTDEVQSRFYERFYEFQGFHAFMTSKNCEKNHINFELGTQPALTCSRLTIETLEQGVNYVQK